MATAISEWSWPLTCILRDAGNGPVVTCSSSILGARFAGESGAASGIVDLHAAVAHRRRTEFGCRERSCPSAGTSRIRFKGFPRPAYSGPAVSQPPAGAPLGHAIIGAGRGGRQEAGRAMVASLR